MKKRIIFLTAFFLSITIFSQELLKKVDECSKKGDFKCAEINILELIKTETNPAVLAPYLSNLGVFQRRQGKNADAFKSFEKSQKIDPKYFQNYINHAALYSIVGNNEKGIEILNKGLKVEPESIELLLARSTNYLESMKNMLAEKDALQVLKLDLENVKAKINLAVIKQNNGNLEEALKDFNKIIETSKPDASVFYKRGEVYLKLKKNIEAIKDYDHSIAINSKFFLSYIRKSELNFLDNKKTEGCKNLKKALEYGANKLMYKDLMVKCP